MSTPDQHGNHTAQEGCDRCDCGCKYWENDHCIDCGTKHDPAKFGRPVGLTKPTVHLNGSGFKNLFEQYAGAAGSIRKAIEDLPVPHGRDYYVQETGAFEAARKEHQSRVQKLRGVLGELEEILEDLSDQNDKRRRR